MESTMFLGKAVSRPGGGYSETPKASYNLGIFTPTTPNGTQGAVEVFMVEFTLAKPRFTEVRNIRTEEQCKDGQRPFNLAVKDSDDNQIYKCAYRVRVTNAKGSSELWLDAHYLPNIKVEGGKLSIEGKLIRSKEDAEFPWLSFSGTSISTIDATTKWLVSNDKFINANIPAMA